MTKTLAALIVLAIICQGFSVLQSHAYSQAILLADASADNSTDWPMFHHDLSLSGVSSSMAPNTNDTVWIYDTGSPIYSSPAVAKGITYIGAQDGMLYAIDSITGEPIWTYRTENAIYSSPAVAEGNVYFLSTDGRIYALEASSGSHVWDVAIGPGSWDWSSPAVHEGKVFIAGSSGWVYSLNASTGAIEWSTFVGGEPNSMITVANGKVFAGTHNFDATAPTLAALNELTGAIVWTYNHTLWHPPTVGMINCNGVAVVDGDKDGDLEVYFGIVTWGGTGNEAICLDESSGREIWTHNLNGWSTSTPAVHDGRVFIGSDDGNMYALDVATGTLHWNYTTRGPVWAAPAVADRKVFFGSLDHILYAVDESNGTPLWSYNTSQSRLISSPAVADGKVFVGNENGKVYAFGRVTGVHDVAVLGATVSKTVVGQGYSVVVNVMVVNLGEYDEVFNVTAYAGQSVIGAALGVQLGPNGTLGLRFEWDTAEYRLGMYIVSVYASPVPGESNLSNNVSTDGTVLVTIPGDVNGDRKVNLKDIFTIARAFGSTSGGARYRPNVDINGDGRIDWKDLLIAIKNFGLQWQEPA